MIKKIKKINFNHSFIFFLLCNFFSLTAYLINNYTISPIVCFFLILTVGVSHGALDNDKGKRLLQTFNKNNMFYFYLLYSLIAFSIIVLWFFFPTFTLIFFLVIASFHFGKEDTDFLIEKNSLFNEFLFFLKGTLIILAPIFFHFDETISIFKLLLVDNESFYRSLGFIESNNILYLLILLSTLSNIFLFLKKFEIKKFIIFFDYFSILIINYFFSPLLAFTIYFCFLHSIRHTITIIIDLDKNSLTNGFKIFLIKAFPLTLLTGIIGLIFLYFLNNFYDFDNSIMKIIFIGLASLTFPHILLEYIIEKNEK